MLAQSRYHKQAQRGIVLVLVLAMLGLLALIGVTFATFSGQAKINAKNFYQGVITPQDDELMDFALSQLITDTGDARSAIHGHSLARDMYGSDGSNNGYLPYHPTYGTPFYITAAPVAVSPGVYSIQTNIQSNDPNFYGYTTFVHWIVRISYTGNPTSSTVTTPFGSSTLAGNNSVTQTFEVTADSGFNSSSSNPRVLNVAVLDPTNTPVTTTYPSISGQTYGLTTTSLINWGHSGVTGPSASLLPSAYLAAGAATGNLPFILDGRWLRAFNGPGMAGSAAMANFRYNGLNPNTIGMDEDYDACDLENWFLALQSADGQVMIPSFHRPGIIRYDLLNGVDDWQRLNFDGPNQTALFSSSASRILRPCYADGNDQATFPDLKPDPNTGKIARFIGPTEVGTGYDVDNDGDGVTDSVWLDLGYPSRTDSRGQLYKPLFAFMVIGLNGRIPLNTAGNLAGQSNNTSGPNALSPTYTHTQHLGNTVSEIDPTYALQNAFSAVFFGGIPQNGTGDIDPFNTVNSNLLWPPSVSLGQTSYSTNNTQVDNSTYIPANTSYTGGLDVRLIQLRNLLTGTRPQKNPFAPDKTGLINGDGNNVYGTWTSGVTNGLPYYIPNGIADYGGDTMFAMDPNGNPLVQRTTPPVGGRWGEAASIPGVPFYLPNNTTPFNLVQTSFANPIRAGYSFDITDLVNAINSPGGQTAYDSNGDPIFPRDAADDNYNAFDVFPPRLTGEVGDADFYDAAGGLLLPVERMRRFVTPVNINGSGRVAQFTDTVSNNIIRRGSYLGPDNYGRVQFSSYFRPAGAPGVISTQYTYDSADGTYTAVGAGLGSIVYPSSTPPNPDPYYTSGPNTFVNYLTPYPYGTSATAPAPVEISFPSYLPDVTNNPFHGFESFKIPNLLQNIGSPTASFPPYNPNTLAGMPVDQNALTVAYLEQDGATSASLPAAWTANPPTQSPPSLPTTLPTYDNKVNSSAKLDGVNEADEMNLYAPNPLLDSPFGPSDLEWLYRQQDIDGATLTSRLSQLAPISFTNVLDGPRRRRLFALDSWDTNNFIWANDNPGGFFANNARFTTGTSPSFAGLPNSVAPLTRVTPTLAQRDRKINLNFPLPVSNDCNEPVRQKWISDTYQLLKAILPPDGVDTAEELAQLSQFVINIVDFRDPDGTMTHWINPDVWLTPSTSTLSYPMLSIGPPTTTNPVGGYLDQYGMEYNPVAINEVLAYSFDSLQTPTSRNGVVQNSRFFIELVNTLTAAYNANYDYGNQLNPNNYYANQASTLDLGGLCTYITPSGTPPASDPYGAGCWDLVFTADDGMSRPDPYRGELSAYTTSGITNYYALIPLGRDSFITPSSPTPNQNVPINTPNYGDVSLIPILANPPGNANAPTLPPIYLPNPNPPVSTNAGVTPAPTGGVPVTYFYVIANPPVSSNYDPNPISITYPSTTYPAVTRNLLALYDPMPALTTTYNAQGTGSTSATPTGPTINWRFGILPGVIANPTTGVNQPPTNFQWKIPSLGLPAGQSGNSVGNTKFYWVCLRRPANPFAPVSAINPMCVVDSMRFPYVDGTFSTWAKDTLNNYYVTGTANTIYSAQRLQPYRGGHAVPPPNLTGTGTTTNPPDPRYGYTEQICLPTTTTMSKAIQTYGAVSKLSNSYYPATPYIQYHTLGQPNSSAENWDYLVFNDRDFSSVAELMLVPGCPPGLFTKQFAEFAPSLLNVVNVFSQVTPAFTPSFPTSTITAPSGGGGPTPGSGTVATPLRAFATATAPFISLSEASSPYVNSSSPTAISQAFPPVNSTGYAPPTTMAAVPGLSVPTTQPGSNITTPLQPHTFPYLVDKFFYTGASSFYYPPTNGVTDPSASGNYVVGGPGADGWFKMFDFFEVPTQANGAIGPVIQGNNFDWARQDTKPGLMNPNLIIDEEAFFAVFGRQSSSFTQTLLNGIELPPWPSLPNMPYTLPLTGNASNGTPIPPIPFGYSPIPLVVSALQANGAPNYVYPLVDQTSVQQGYLATDPIQTAINGVNYPTANGPTPPGVGNRLKAAFAQFLWLRHGGSGYLFGHGSGLSTIQLPGQNTAVVTVNGGNQTNTLPIPSDRPFRSLSFPDINYTIMRPTALPPSTYSNPPALNNNAATNALQLYNTTLTPNPPVAGQTPTFFLTQAYYSPYVTNSNFATGAPVVYTGDPGVRNPFLSQGYATSWTTGTTFVPPPYAVTTIPAGVPIPVNLAWPAGTNTMTNVVNPPITDVMVLPPVIPPARLFQTPDAYGAGAMMIYGYNGTVMISPPVSNAGDSGDPWINNQIPGGPPINNIANLPTQVMPGTGTYALNNGFPSLVWPWMSTNGTGLSVGSEYGVGGTTTYPPNPATGVLPLVQPVGAPGTATNLSMGSSNPYLGSMNSPSLTQSLTGTDDRQHPYWRTEHLQSAMNLTTVRTHQYAVWITIGFFEIRRTGDIGMLGQGAPQAAFDVMGPEIGALTGSNVRFRGFFLVDRTKLTGFNYNSVGSFRAAVLYRKIIQ